MFKTTDGGQSWQPARNGLTFYPIRSLQIAPQHPNTLYAGTDFDGIWKSTDGGNTWADSSSGLGKDLVVFSIVIDPQNTNTLYAGLAGGSGLYIGHIYKSQNGGATWALQDMGIPLEAGTYINGVLTLAIHPAVPSTVYAGTNYDGALRPRTGGKPGQPSTTACPSGARPRTVSRSMPWPWIHIMGTGSPPSSAVSIIALQPTSGRKSARAWSILTAASLQIICTIIRPILLPSTALVTALPSARAGHHLDKTAGLANLGTRSRHCLSSVNPRYDLRGSDVLFDYTGGVHKSSDQGKAWSEASQGITAAKIYGVAIDPQNSSHIYAGTGDGFFYRSQDGGATWSRGYYTVNPPPYQQRRYSFGAIARSPLILWIRRRYTSPPPPSFTHPLTLARYSTK